MKHSTGETVATGYVTVSRRVGVSPKPTGCDARRHIGNFRPDDAGLSVGARAATSQIRSHSDGRLLCPLRIFDSTTYPFSGEEHNPYRGDFVYRVGKEKAADVLKPF